MEYLYFHSKKILTTTKEAQNLHVMMKKEFKMVDNAEWNNTFGKWYVHTKCSPPHKKTKQPCQLFLAF